MHGPESERNENDTTIERNKRDVKDIWKDKQMDQWLGWMEGLTDGRMFKLMKNRMNE